MGIRPDIDSIIPGAAMGLISSAVHKQKSWELSIGAQCPDIIPTPIPVPRGLREPDIPRPEETAVGKLTSFAGQVNMAPVARRMGLRATGTIMDVLFVANGEVQTTDRDGVGALFAIAALGSLLSNDSGRPGTIEIYTVTGTARVADMAKYKEELPSKLVYSAWESGRISLSVGLIELLSNPKDLFALHRLGVVGPGIVNPKSIAAINWPDLISWVPSIAKNVRGGSRSIYAELQLGRHDYHMITSETSNEDVETAARNLTKMVRGIPDTLVPGIVGYYLQ